MWATYDLGVDVLRIELSHSSIEESDEVVPGIILDYDMDGNLVGVEVLDASWRVENPSGIDYQMLNIE